MRGVIVGASGGLGRVLSDELAARGWGLRLVASDRRDLDATAADLALRYGVPTSVIEADLVRLTDETIDRIVDRDDAGIDAFFYVAGVGDERDDRPLDDVVAERLLAVNYGAGLRLINGLLKRIAPDSKIDIVGVGSVAAVRGRGRNIVYGSAKRGLEAYFEALRHRLQNTACRLQFYRVGYMKTPMLAGAKPVLPVADPRDVARLIVNNLGKDIGIGYAPRWWRIVSFVVRHLPWQIFRRLGH